MRLRQAMLALAVAATVGCDNGTTEPDSLVGTYNATTLRFTPTGQPTINALALGATLTISITASNTTTGTFFFPASIAGGTAITESMTGTVVRSGNTVTFQQTADTFVRDVTFTVVGNTLEATDSAAGVSFVVVLTRQ